MTSYGNAPVATLGAGPVDAERERRPVTRLDILQGTLDLLILRTLAGVPLHGYQIARAIKATMLASSPGK